MMKSIIACLTGVVFLLNTGFAQGSPDDASRILEDQYIAYQDLLDRIQQLPDHITLSLNELDTKAAEINDLLKDLTETQELASSTYSDLEDQMDSFDAACRWALEENCPEKEKEIEKILWKIEPLVELGQEPVFILESLDNRYDEKLMLKLFDDAGKSCLDFLKKMEKLQYQFEEFSGTCFSD